MKRNGLKKLWCINSSFRSRKDKVFLVWNVLSASLGYGYYIKCLLINGLKTIHRTRRKTRKICRCIKSKEYGKGKKSVVKIILSNFLEFVVGIILKLILEWLLEWSMESFTLKFLIKFLDSIKEFLDI